MSDRARLAISLVLNMVIAPIAMAVVPWVNSIGDHFAAAAASLSFFWPAMVLSGCVQYWSTAPAENPLARLIAGLVALPAGVAVIFCSILRSRCCFRISRAGWAPRPRVGPARC